MTCVWIRLCLYIWVDSLRLEFFLTNLKTFPRFSWFSQSKVEANRSRDLWVMITKRAINSCTMYVSRIKINWWNSYVSVVWAINISWVKRNLGETKYWVKCELGETLLGETLSYQELGETWLGELSFASTRQKWYRIVIWKYHSVNEVLLEN